MKRDDVPPVCLPALCQPTNSPKSKNSSSLMWTAALIHTGVCRVLICVWRAWLCVSVGVNGVHDEEERGAEEHIAPIWSIHQCCLLVKLIFVSAIVEDISGKNFTSRRKGKSLGRLVHPSIHPSIHLSIHPSIPTEYTLKLLLHDDHRLQLAVAIWCTRSSLCRKFVMLVDD